MAVSNFVQTLYFLLKVYIQGGGAGGTLVVLKA